MCITVSLVLSISLSLSLYLSLCALYVYAIICSIYSFVIYSAILASKSRNKPCRGFHKASAYTQQQRVWEGNVREVGVVRVCVRNSCASGLAAHSHKHTHTHTHTELAAHGQN